VIAYDPRAGLYAAGASFGLPEPERIPVPDDRELELLVRFEHPAKLLAVAELPGAARLGGVAEARAYAVAPDAVARVRAALRSLVEAAGARLLGDPGLHALAAGTVVALGDSITDDLLSWAEILRAALAVGRPGEVVLVNAGVSGDTTADALRRLHGVAVLRPALVLAMLGTNDCQRHGPAAARLVSDADADANAAAISAWLRAEGARVVWLTPPPVDEAALANAVAERPFALRNREARAFGERLAALGDPVIDTGAAVRAGPLDRLLLSDGVHPSLEGQLAIARELLRALAAGHGGSGGGSGQNHSGAGQP
jgi:lysophospholipase L1-like esterase